MPSKARAASRLRSVPLDTNTTAKAKPNARKRAASIAAGGEEEKAPPRKRGRGAKNALDTNKAPIKENVAQDLGDGEDGPPPRKRGRPPKTVQAAAGGPIQEKVLARGSRTHAINALPQPASHPRPARLCFVFGTGDFGQFGLGTETLGEISRPRLHAWFEAAAKADILGSKGAGVEKICAGGMHTLAIDEAGKVKTKLTLCSNAVLI